MSEWLDEHESEFQGKILRNEPLSRHTYYRIGGPAKWMVFPQCESDLLVLSKAISAMKLPYFIMGAGSNLLAADEGFSGIVIKTSRLNLEISATSDILKIGASVSLSSFLRRAAQEGWDGFEILSGIPGWIGGAVAMNAGTHLGETASLLKKVRIWDLEQSQWKHFEGNELKFEYRKNLFLPQSAVIFSTEWKLKLAPPVEVNQKIDENLERRKASQPLNFPSCGSVFKNPKDTPLKAWEVIQKLGLRGHQIGNAQVSKKHPNWIVNLGGARASDVKGLVDLIQTRARNELGISLEVEVRFLNG